MADKSTANAKRELTNFDSAAREFFPSISLQLMSKEEARSSGEGTRKAALHQLCFEEDSFDKIICHHSVDEAPAGHAFGAEPGGSSALGCATERQCTPDNRNRYSFGSRSSRNTSSRALQ